MARHWPGINLKVPSLTNELIAQLDVLLMDGPKYKPEFVFRASGLNVEIWSKLRYLYMRQDMLLPLQCSNHSSKFR